VLTAREARAAGLSRPFYVVALLALVLGINYIDRGAMPTAALQIRHDLALTAQDYGILFSAFWYVYFWVQIPVGALAERYGAHWVLAGGLVIWAGATILMGAAVGFWSVFVVRLMLGLGESVGFPCVSKLLACVVPLESLGKANGIVGLGYLMAPGLGIWLAGLLIDAVGWRGMFLLLGVGSLLWLVPWSRVKLPQLATARRCGDSDLGDGALAARAVGYEPGALLQQLPLVLHARLAAELSRGGAWFLDARDGASRHRGLPRERRNGAPHWLAG